MTNDTLRERLTTLMRQEDYLPLTTKELGQNLSLSPRSSGKLKHVLREMLTSGLIVQVKENRYCLAEEADLIGGRIQFRQTGSALLVPEDGSDPVSIPAEDTWVAMHGDKVLVRLQATKGASHHRGGRGKSPGVQVRCGRVIRILERARTFTTGTLEKSKLFHFVVPDDPRLIQDIYVLDPSKSSLKPKPAVGDKVVVQIHEWKQRHINPEGEITEILGRSLEPAAEKKAVFRKFSLDQSFPAPVMEEVKTVPTQVTAKQLRGRLDCRNMPVFTIDPDDAKDFDDALSIEERAEGGWRVGVHIADVSSYVRPNGALDREAQRRGNSTYLVGTVIPMLPHELSNGICSLVEGADRLTKTVFLEFGRNGQLTGHSFAHSVIRSRKRLTYRQALAFLKEESIEAIRRTPLPPAHQTGSTGRPLSELSVKEISDLQGWIRQLWDLASQMRNQRMKKGSLDLDMPETKIFVDENGYADRIEKIEYDESHQLIEEYMLAANEAVAATLRKAGMPCLYRVHDDPDPAKLDEFRLFLSTFGLNPGDLTRKKQMLRLLADLKSHEQGYLLRIQLLRNLKKAVYRATPDGHYGLGKENYAHFTSPIRRYADLVVHRILSVHLAKTREQTLPGLGKITLPDPVQLASLAEHISRTELNSQEAERESVKTKLLEFFERQLEKPEPDVFPAVILEVRNHGFFVELTESMAYGMVHLSTLRDDFYQLSSDGTAVVGKRLGNRYGVGSHIRVKVARVDRYKRQIDFAVVQESPPNSKNKKQPRSAHRGRKRNRPVKSN